jgi:hypothetical protein
VVDLVSVEFSERDGSSFVFIPGMQRGSEVKQEKSACLPALLRSIGLKWCKSERLLMLLVSERQTSKMFGLGC